MPQNVPPPDRWTDDILEPMRQLGDPLADNAVRTIFEAGEIGAVNQMMRTLVENDDVLPASLPPVIQDFLTQSGTLPGWVDPAKIEAGEKLFWLYGPSIVTSLLCYSLPACYLGHRGVRALALTGRLYTNPLRRVMQTAQMVIDVMQSGGVAPGARGIRTTQKVRLMHAGVRYQIGVHAQWDTAAFGVPVDQEDMAGTLLTFSWVCIDGLRKMGFEITDEQADGYLHCWNIVGHVLGIREELLTRDMQDAGALMHAIQRRQYGPSEDGVYMNTALLNMMQDELPVLLRTVPPALMRHFLGDRNAAWLGVPPHRVTEALLHPISFLNLDASMVFGACPESRIVAEHISNHILPAVVRLGNRLRPVPFAIPQNLRRHWGLDA